MPGPAVVRFTVDTITPTLKGAAARARNLRPALQAFGKRMIRSVDENFRRQGRRNGRGRAWKKLSPVTLAMRPKGKRGKRARILVVSALLRNSTVARAGRRTLAVGSPLKYANDHHQDGNWSGVITKTERKRVESHQREMWVRPERSRRRKKAKKSKPRRQARKGRTTKPRGTPRKTSSQLRSTLNMLRARLRRARRRSGGAPSAGLVKRKVRVRAHFQNRTSRIPARPIYVFQPTDLRAWQKIQRRWIRTGTVAGAA